MKVNFVLPFIDVGGGARVVFEYANRLQERGHDVFITYPLIPYYIKPKYSIYDVASLTYRTFSNLKLNNQVDWFDLKVDLVRIISMSSKISKFAEISLPDADVVVATSWETAYYVDKLSKKKGKKYYFVQSYEIWDLWQNEMCWKKVEQIEKNPANQPLAMSRIIPEYSYLKKSKELVDSTYVMGNFKKITISSWLEKLLENTFHQKVEATISNGINLNEFFCDDIGNKLNMDTKSITILSSVRGGSLLKGDFDLLEALDIVRFKFPEINVILYGSRRNLKIPSWVQFVNRPFGESLRRLYCSAQIFVSASRLEGFGMPPMEAMACGCAVVATNVGGIPDYTIDGETVIAVSPRNPKKLAEGIIKLIENEGYRKRVAKNGYNHIRQFTWEKATDCLEEVLLRFL